MTTLRTRLDRLDALARDYPGRWTADRVADRVADGTDVPRFAALAEHEDGDQWVSLHEELSDAFAYLGDEALTGWAPLGVADLETGESIPIEVGAPVVSRSDHAQAMPMPWGVER